MSVLDDGQVCEQLRQAWLDSQPGTGTAHEEGGFIVRADDGTLSIEPWLQGSQNEIMVPPHPGGLFGGRRIVATFHTHPNTGPDYQQEPSLTDIRAVRGDPDLRHADYEGEFVIAQDVLYRINPDGTVEEMGSTADLLKIS
jgi:hypothetical protein